MQQILKNYYCYLIASVVVVVLDVGVVNSFTIYRYNSNNNKKCGGIFMPFIPNSIFQRRTKHTSLNQRWLATKLSAPLLEKEEILNDKVENVLHNDQNNQTHTSTDVEVTTTSSEIDEVVTMMNGDAKIEEADDRQNIINAIQAFQLHSKYYKEDIKAQIPIGTIVQRTLDTMEDIFLHVRRLPYEYGWVSETIPNDDRRTIVVLGSGWAAHALLKVADTYKLRIIVVSPSNHFVFTPMLASAAVGTVEYRSMTEAIRAANPMIDNYIEGSATSVDIEQKIVKVQLSNLLSGLREGDPPVVDIKYDTLIVAVGVKVADSLVPGAYDYCVRLKTCEDARRLRISIGEALEYASRPDVIDSDTIPSPERERRRIERSKRVTFAIVGGGPTGVELAGELTDFVKDITKPRVGTYPQLVSDIRIVLIHGGSDLVPQFDVDLRKHALKSLRSGGVDVRLNTKVKEVGDGYMKVVCNGTEEILYTGLNIWAAGTESVPFVQHLLDQLPPDARAPNGKIQVDPWLRCPMPNHTEFGSILVTGDVAAVLSSDHDDTSYLPQTAQVAGQQGAYIARLLDRDYDLAVTPPTLKPTMNNTDDDMMNRFWLHLRNLDQADGFKFLNLGLLAYVGGGEALSQVEIGNVPIFSYAGSISFILWRSVYLVKQVATRNRVLVTFDWIKTYLFGRDITRL